MTGPLTGIRVVEMAGIGPVPHAAMILADLGADVVRVDRQTKAAAADGVADADRAMWRGRALVTADLKDETDREHVLDLIASADVLLEGFRPGVMERLGLGPEICHQRNPQLVYGRMTGWGQTGPLSQRAGHDINYLALTGVLGAMGPADGPPVPPLSMVADFGGGSMLLVLGVVSALWSRDSDRAAVGGRGQVVDASMADGANLLSQLLWSWRAAGRWSDDRGTNLLDGSAPFYRTYECSDGGYVAVGSIEPPFYSQLVAGLGLVESDLPDRWDKEQWPTLTKVFADVFATRSRDGWAAVFADTDACVTPVLAFGEVASHPQMADRGAIIEIDGVAQAAPAPRFSHTPVPVPVAPAELSLQDSIRNWSQR